MSIENRIEELEKRVKPDKSVVIIIAYNGDNTHYTPEQEEEAIADFMANHPKFKEGDQITLEWYDGNFCLGGTRPKFKHIVVNRE